MTEAASILNLKQDMKVVNILKFKIDIHLLSPPCQKVLCKLICPMNEEELCQWTVKPPDSSLLATTASLWEVSLKKTNYHETNKP